ncbi:diguanylate cyclase domain-containing protein [Aliamphritea spongicola]|nr:diguanylate cyclase [Aliamphritea spongicola]
MQANSEELKVSDGIFQGWQQTVNLIAELASIPAALIMRISHDSIQVFATSESENNPYDRGMTEPLGQGLYCETVVAEQSQLLVPNALINNDWNQNPDIALGMISYCGLPLNWPDGKPFGTICMLDSKENCYTPQALKLLDRFRETIETDLRIIFEKHSFEQANLQLEARIAERTQELEDLNRKLSKEIDRRNASEHTLQYNQQYDALTGLANRSSLMHSLEAQLEQLNPVRSGIAVLYLSLTNFKSINNSYGHVIGDTVLRELARRIQNNLDHHQFAARIIGDEFVIITQPSKPEQTTCQDFKEQTLDLAQQISKLCQKAFHINGHSITVIANIGIAMAPMTALKPLH